MRPWLHTGCGHMSLGDGKERVGGGEGAGDDGELEMRGKERRREEERREGNQQSHIGR